MAWGRALDVADEARHYRRDFVKFLRSESTLASDFDAAELIYGELIGNVIRHAPGPVRITFEWQGAIGELRVRDNGPGFEPSFAPPSPQSESGRGLQIVRSLAVQIAVHCDADGCEVRVVLPVTRR